MIIRAGIHTRAHMTSLVVHVGAGVHTLLRELGQGNFEALLDRLQDSLVVGAADKRDAETLGSKTTGTTDTVEVRVGFVGHIVVDGNIDALNVDTTTEDVSGDTNTGLEVLELLVALDTDRLSGYESCELGDGHLPLLLTNTGVDRSTGEVALAQKLVKLCATQSRANEDDNLVELQLIEKVVKFPVLLTLVELHVVLLQTVESQLLFVIDVDLERVLHELLAGLADLFC